MGKYHPVLLVAIVTIVCLALSAEAQEEPVGSITDVEGTVHLVRGGSETRELGRL